MNGKVLQTPVDALVELIKENDGISLTQVSSKIGVPKVVVEKWLVILEEFSILRIEYKGFETYLHYTEKEDKSKEDELSIDSIKHDFIQKAREKKYSYDMVRKLWPEFVREHEEELKKIFLQKARKMGYEQRRIDSAWQKYRRELEVL